MKRVCVGGGLGGKSAEGNGTAEGGEKAIKEGGVADSGRVGRSESRGQGRGTDPRAMEGNTREGGGAGLGGGGGYLLHGMAEEAGSNLMVGLADLMPKRGRPVGRQQKTLPDVLIIWK